MSGAITKNILFSCSSNVPIDFNLYKKFWALQDYFRNPTQCYTAAAWKPFTDVSSTVSGFCSSECCLFHKLD